MVNPGPTKEITKLDHELSDCIQSECLKRVELKFMLIGLGQD